MQGVRILWNGLKTAWRELKVPPIDPKIEAERKTAASLHWRRQYQKAERKV